MRRIFIQIFILLCILQMTSCIVVHNKENLLSSDIIRDKKDSIKKELKVYYEIQKVKNHPYIEQSKGQYILDTTQVYDQLRINPIILFSNRVLKVLPSFSGQDIDMMIENNINCDLELSDSLEGALKVLDCYLENYAKIQRNYFEKILNQGVYSIVGETITIQYYYSLLGEFYLYEEKGIILNDSTFVLTDAKDYRNNKQIKINKKFILYLQQDFSIEEFEILKLKRSGKGQNKK